MATTQRSGYSAKSVAATSTAWTSADSSSTPASYRRLLRDARRGGRTTRALAASSEKMSTAYAAA